MEGCIGKGVDLEAGDGSVGAVGEKASWGMACESSVERDEHFVVVSWKVTVYRVGTLLS